MPQPHCIVIYDNNPQATEHMYVCAIISIIIPNRDGVHENRQSKLSSKRMLSSQVMCMNDKTS